MSCNTDSRKARTPDQAFRERFGRFLNRPLEHMRSLRETVQIVRKRGWEVFVFGGVPRGIFDRSRHYFPRDLDLVFKDEDFLSFESAFAQHIERRNRFGGLNLRIGSLVINAWPLSATWAFREGLVQGESFENLPKTTFLNLDGVVVELAPRAGNRRRVYEHGFFTAWHDLTLDITLIENPFPALCAVRTLHLAQRFGFRVSHQLGKYLRDVVGKVPMLELQKAQVSHYGRMEFDFADLLRIFNKIERELSKGGQTPLVLFPVRPRQMELQREWATGWHTDIPFPAGGLAPDESAGHPPEQYCQASFEGFANYLVCTSPP